MGGFPIVGSLFGSGAFLNLGSRHGRHATPDTTHARHTNTDRTQHRLHRHLCRGIPFGASASSPHVPHRPHKVSYWGDTYDSTGTAATVQISVEAAALAVEARRQDAQKGEANEALLGGAQQEGCGFLGETLNASESW